MSMSFFILVKYYKTITSPWMEFKNIYSFRFTDSAGFSQNFGGDGWLQGTEHEYYSYQGCKLAYLSGKIKDGRLFTIKPYFECPSATNL